MIEYYDGEAVEIYDMVHSGYYSNWDYEEEHHSLEYIAVTSVDTFRFGIHYVEKDSSIKLILESEIYMS